MYFTATHPLIITCRQSVDYQYLVPLHPPPRLLPTTEPLPHHNPLATSPFPLPFAFSFFFFLFIILLAKAAILLQLFSFFFVSVCLLATSRICLRVAIAIQLARAHRLARHGFQDGALQEHTHQDHDWN